VSSIFLITGATGFVGRNVLKAVSAMGITSRVVLRKGSSANIPGNCLVEKIIETDDLFHESAEWWYEVSQGIDTVIHVAWYAEPGKYLQSPLNQDCLNGSLNMISGTAKAGIRKFVGVGTCFEYDLSFGYLAAGTPLKPETPYARAKAALFHHLQDFAATHDIAYNWCRLFYLYGEQEDERRLVAYIRAKLQKGETAELTSGTQVRDFLDVSEAGRMIAATAVQDSYSGPVNICSGIPITVRELAERIADEYGRKDLLKFGARPDNLVDPKVVVGIKTLDL
jgi:nucleoside-diphosphate-sugar epimerase